MLIDYMPTFLQDLEEYKELMGSLDVEVTKLNDNITYELKQANIMEADEKRVKAWEAFLKIQKQGDLYQRKLYIIATLTSVGKLNQRKIEEIVNIYTNGGGAVVEFSESTIRVRVKPPNNGEIFLFPDIERTLEKMKPAHLLLSVIRYYTIWGDIEKSFDNINAVEDYFQNVQAVETWVKE